jgi:hypothetical protein
VRRGKAAAKGATVIFWRLAGGGEDALALRVLLFMLDFVAIFFLMDAAEKQKWRTLSLAPEYIFDENGTMVDESTLDLTVILHGTTQTRCIVVPKATDNALTTLTKSLAISSVPSCTIV